MPLFANPDLDALYKALTALAVFALLVGQSWYQDYRIKKLLKPVENNAKDARRAAVLTHSTVNGTGFAGALERIEKEQKDHATSDNLRFGGISEDLRLLKRRAGIPVQEPTEKPL